jgi:hypothetical protein
VRQSWLFVAVSKRPVFLESSKSQAGAGLFAPPPRSTQQPICDADDFGRLFPMPPLLGVLNGVVDDAAFLVKFEQEQAGELLVGSSRPRDHACDLRDNIADLAALLVRLSAGFPFDNQLFASQIRRSGCAAILHHPLG